MGAQLLQPTLTGGEMSPSLYGRVDINRYMTSLKRCRNFLVRPYGGCENRNGFAFCAENADTSDHRLIPFVYSTEASYVVFMGDGYLRFQSGGADIAPTAPAYAGGTTYGLDAYVTDDDIVYRSLQAANLGNTPASSPLWWVADAGLQISSPWTSAQVDAVRYTQSADVLYLVHPAVAPRELRRLTANTFEIRLFDNKEGPFLDLNANEAIKVAATGVQGEIVLTSSEDIFTANAVGALFYLEPKNLGTLVPWVVGDRGVALGDLRRSDGKTYKAVTIPAAGDWHETGPRQPIHENGRHWDGPGTTRDNGVDDWSVGIEWEFVDSGYGVAKITAVSDARTASATVTKRLPAQVVGGVGSPANSWPLVGDGVTRTFALAGAGFGVYAVTIGGVGVTPDPNYSPPPPIGGGPCPQVDMILRGKDGPVRAGDVRIGDWLWLGDPETGDEALGQVSYSQTQPARLWRVYTAREVSAVFSDSAPIPVRGGGYRTPTQLMGYEIPVSLDGVFCFDVIADIMCLGDGFVQLITVGDRCFWVSEDGKSFILHHNSKPTDIDTP